MKKILLTLVCFLSVFGVSAREETFQPEKIQDGVILHCFVWPLRDIINELPAIADAGFTAVQISPMQAPNVAGQPWYYTYGPCDYRFYESVLGSRADLTELCEKAASYGIKIIMDVAANHIIHDGEDPWRAPGQTADPWWREEGRAIMDQGDVKWDSRWSFTHQNIFGFEVVTSREDVQQRMREYLADLRSMGVAGIRWDSAKHIAVPSEGDNFWAAVLDGSGLWHYAEILYGIDYADKLIKEYGDLLSMTDVGFDGKSPENPYHAYNIPRQRCVFWAESHDTFSNDQTGSQRISQNDIDRRWALVASRKGASALYFSRPGLLPKDDIKLAVKGSNHFTAPEVREVNIFHNIMGNEPEDFYNSGNVAAVYRRKGVVIVTETPGTVEIPCKNLLTGLTYSDQITGNGFQIVGDKLVGEVGASRIAVVYDGSQAKAPLASVSIAPLTRAFTSETATFTLFPSYCGSATYSIDGKPAVTITEPTKITIGEGVDYDCDITIKWQAGEGEQQNTGEFVITKADPKPTYVFMRSDRDWDDLKAYTFIYDYDTNNGQWPGEEMTYDPDMTIRGKTGWWKANVPDYLKIDGMAMVSTSGTYRYPADGVPGIPLDRKSMTFEYEAGKWTVTQIDDEDILEGDKFNEITDGLPSSSWGKLRRFMASCKALDGTFTIDVLLPEDYDPQLDGGYPVIYANDGQNLFDDAIAFGGKSWNVDAALGTLSDKALVRDAIIVGIHNRSTLRPSDYIPEKVCTEHIAAADQQDSGMWSLTDGIFNSDEYTAFLAGTVKRNIDRLFNTASDRANTFTMGSSMGALAALYAVCEYPDVFGGAACLSTHWIGDFNYSNTIFPEAMASYLSANLPSPADHKLYLDRGTADLDAAYEPWETQMRSLIREKGYNESDGSLSTFTDEGASHNEYYWARRVDRPLYYFLALPGTVYNPGTPEEEEFHVVFCDSRYTWAAPAAFTWTGTTGILQLGNWPGTKMTATTYLGEPAWEIRFRHSTAPSNIIFNDGRATGAVQTKDLPFLNHYVYTFDGPVSPFSSVGITAGDTSDIEVSIEGSEIVIRSATATDMLLSSIDGRCRVIPVHPGENRYAAPEPGIFIVAIPGHPTRKLAVRRTHAHR